MGKDEFSAELLEILDQALTLIRHDLGTIRNEVMEQRLEISGLTHMLTGVKENRAIQSKLLTVIIGGIIAGGSSLLVAVLQFFKK